MKNNMIKKTNKKNIVKVACVIALAVVIFILTFLFSFTGGTKELMVLSAKVENAGLVPFVDEFGYQSFKKESDREFKILQLTDLHIGNGKLCEGKDKLAYNAIKRLVEETVPDLVIITGDLVYPLPFQTGSRNNLLAYQNVGKFMEGFEIPWTLVFGNHDTETFATNSKREISDYLETLEFCIFETNDVGITGLGNNFINIYNPDNSIDVSLCLLDAGMTVRNIQLLGYEPVADDQTEWYENEIKRISKSEETLVKSLVFLHIPPKVYLTAWKLHKNGSDEVELLFGAAGERGEKIACPKTDGKLFDTICRLGSTEGIFCGHDHLNDFSVVYKGVQLTFAKSIDYTAYLGIAKKTNQRGGTTIKIDNNSNFIVEHIKLVDIN